MYINININIYKYILILLIIYTYFIFIFIFILFWPLYLKESRARNIIHIKNEFLAVQNSISVSIRLFDLNIIILIMLNYSIQFLRSSMMELILYALVLNPLLESSLYPNLR